MNEMEIAITKKEIQTAQNRIKEYESKINSLKNDNDKIKANIKILNKNIILYKTKGKYEIVKDQVSTTKGPLLTAKSDISDAYLSYSKGFQGNAANVKLSTLRDANSKIRNILDRLGDVYDIATEKITKTQEKINSNNATMHISTSSEATCRKKITELEEKKSFNTKKIDEYRKKILEKKGYISRLKSKLI